MFYHGELIAQRKAGFAPSAAATYTAMPQQHRLFYAGLSQCGRCRRLSGRGPVAGRAGLCAGDRRNAFAHRGGPPRFTKLKQGKLKIVDYAGNRYINTSGNLLPDWR